MKKKNHRDRVCSLKKIKEQGNKTGAKHCPKLSQSDPNPTSPITTESITEEKTKIKTLVKIQLRYTVQAFKKSSLFVPSFIAAIDPEMAKTVRRCLTNKNPALWKTIRIWVKTIGELLQAAILSYYHPQERKILDLDEASIIINTAHITGKKIHSVKSSSYELLSRLITQIETPNQPQSKKSGSP